MRLKPHQQIILSLAANGRTDAQIGELLGVGPSAVTRHLTAIYRKLGATNRAHAVALGLITGELTAEDVQPTGT
ncbi:helix-turn-helix transcriptional regulator [Streptomyces sp. NPDC088124]|uniref:helix-turn-helix domain-containing protein n=1 Tax=Streptomyces sp. NPDC088124 TaxID=3154654 RepID=UPI003420C983